MAEYKRKDMPEDMIVRISPGRNTITVQECSANGVVSYREIDPIEFYFALNGSCISNVYQRSGFLPEHCLHISMNAEERHYAIWNPELRADVIYRDRIPKLPAPAADIWSPGPRQRESCRLLYGRRR